MEDEEFSVWCDINLSDDSAKMTMKEMGHREGVGMLLTKFHIYSIFTTSHCAKYPQNYHKRKECSFSFQNSIGFVYFFFFFYNSLVAIIFCSLLPSTAGNSWLSVRKC